MSSLIQRCSKMQCDGEAVAVVKIDPLNGDRLCFDHLEEWLELNKP